MQKSPAEMDKVHCRRLIDRRRRLHNRLGVMQRNDTCSMKSFADTIRAGVA